MALTTARISSSRGRPPGLGGGIKSLIRSHSASVRSVGYGLAVIPPVYRTDATYGRLFKQPLRVIILHENIVDPAMAGKFGAGFGGRPHAIRMALSGEAIGRHARFEANLVEQVEQAPHTRFPAIVRIGKREKIDFSLFSRVAVLAVILKGLEGKPNRHGNVRVARPCPWPRITTLCRHTCLLYSPQTSSAPFRDGNNRARNLRFVSQGSEHRWRLPCQSRTYGPRVVSSVVGQR